MPNRYFSSGSYRYGFNGKENDNEVKGVQGSQQDYGMRIYDPRLGRFLSVDPLFQSYPSLTSYQYAGNCPIKFIDLDGLEKVDPTVENFYKTSPKIDMSAAPAGSALNAAGFQRNGPWFWRQMLKTNPEMFSPENVAQIKSGSSPIIDETWVAANPSHKGYNGKLIHHHVNQGKMAVGIPEKVHYDYFSELHPNLKGVAGKLRGSSVKGTLGRTATVLSFSTDFFSFLNGNPDSWIASFPCVGCNPIDDLGKVKKDKNSGLYWTINKVVESYDNKNILTSATLEFDIYSDFIWDDDKKMYMGVNKVDSGKEVWYYNSDGDRTSVKQTLDSNIN